MFTNRSITTGWGRQLRFLASVYPSLVFGFAILAQPVAAAIIGVRGETATTVQELIDGTPGSVNSDQDSGARNNGRFRLDATAELTSTDLDGTILSAGEAVGLLDDPARGNRANPEEFALEVASFSNAEAVSYLVTSNAAESREVVFTTAGSTLARPEIQFRSDGTRGIESRTFVSGAVLVWAMDGALDMSGLEADLLVTIERDNEELPLFSGGLSVRGSEDGDLGANADGPLTFDEVSVDELRSTTVDRNTLAVLDALEEAGRLNLFVVPLQEHAYDYTVRANESFTLTARMEARVRNVPGGTGVAVVLGRPFARLATLLETALPDIDGRALQSAINAAAAKRALVSTEPANGSTVPTRGLACGAFGTELSMMGLLLLGLRFMRPRPQF